MNKAVSSIGYLNFCEQILIRTGCRCRLSFKNVNMITRFMQRVLEKFFNRDLLRNRGPTSDSLEITQPNSYSRLEMDTRNIHILILKFFENAD